ncbi:MAG: gephyrin-like molybdotransferase Glp [Paracoccaceae bacterium]
MMDWSGGNDTGARPCKDAIWAAEARRGQVEKPIYLRNRNLAEAWLQEAITAALSAGERLLIGFDFPFGYPKGFGAAVAGSSDPFALWDWVSDRIEDTPETNNRFDVAAEMNRLFPGVGPFWGNGLKRDIPDLPRKGKARSGHGMQENRIAESRTKGAFTLWQLSGVGAVGSQALMGLPVLNRLRGQFPGDVSVWPFEPLDQSVGIVEIWPSLTVGVAPEGWIKDAWQVHEVARVVSSMAGPTLAKMLDVDAPEEGWILGLGHESDWNISPIPPRLKNDCFALPPGIEWTPVDDALDLLRDRLPPIAHSETCQVMDAGGRILAEDQIALRSHPPAPNTAVDGYGFSGGRPDGTHVLPLVQHRATAGHNIDQPIPEGQAIRVLTGAALPRGVDTVVLQEDVTLADGRVAFHGPVRTGANTRQAGEDVVAGDTVLPKGRRLTPADLGLLSAVGISQVNVRQALRVAVLSTGDEIVQPGQTAHDSQVFDANRPLLLDLAKRMGHAPVDLGHVADDRDALRSRLDKAAQQADVVLTSGGASSGDEDHVSALLSEAGAMALWRIAVKPGRPLALGLWSGTPVFGLPGNPVAAMVCTLIFARPALAQLSGEGWRAPDGYDLPAGFSKNKKPGRREYLRARVRDGKVEIFASEGSGRVSGLSWAEGLVELPDHALEVTPGDLVRFIPWSGFGV